MKATCRICPNSNPVNRGCQTQPRLRDVEAVVLEQSLISLALEIVTLHHFLCIQKNSECSQLRFDP